MFTGLDVVLWDVFFMPIGYLRLRFTDICKKVLYTDIRNTDLHIL